MKIAIHLSAWGFSSDWVTYCKEFGIPFKIVNCYSSNIVDQVKDCDLLLWHHHHTLAKDKTFAHQLLFALEQAGTKVFPDFNTGWHFDDKVGQKYLLEAINAPLVPTEVFYSKKEAIDWVEQTAFPKVFKLRGGAGSTNVKLVKNKEQAQKLTEIAFGQGFPSYDRWGDLRENFRKYHLKMTDRRNLLKSIRRFFVSTEFARIHGREKGYVLFQDFIPNNQYDIRVITIGEKAFAIKRIVRENDFRASGSGTIRYQKEEIDPQCIKIAFETTKKLKAQCVAYDFVFNEKQQPLIVEINYGFAHEAYSKCPGYWDEKMNWHEDKFNAAKLILESLLKNNKYYDEHPIR